MAVVRLIFRPCVRNHPMGVRFAARNHPTAVRFVVRNHPSVTFGDSSPQRGAPAKAGEGWFPVQNLKINRARPVNGPMASIGPYK